MSKPPIAGVRFRNAGKILYFHTAGMRLETGEYVVVETMRGPEIARVVISPEQVLVNELNEEDLKPILRLATDTDLRKADALRTRVEELLPEARRLALEVGFPVRIDTAEFTLDGKRLTFSFTSEERLDYRDYLRRASDRFGARVDMRQLGSRDRAKLAGGYGICGRELCCSNWLTTFPSISIRMAKEQELPLNPQKISGLCGRLLCCLSYEEDGYREMRRSLPKIGQRCSTPTGEAKVIGLNILRRSITLLLGDGQRVDVGDRDLGTVVRWDIASKIGDPPPSISRADAISQGLIEADERDLAGDEEPEPVADRGGRGRLPAPRRLPQARDAKDATATAPPQAARPARGRGRDANQPPATPAPRRPARGGGSPPIADAPAARSGPPQPTGLERSRRNRGASAPADGAPSTPRPERAERPERPERGERTPPPSRGPVTPPAGQSRVFRRGGAAPTEPGESPVEGAPAALPSLPLPPAPRQQTPRAPQPPPNAPDSSASEASGESDSARKRRRRGTRGGKGGRTGEEQTGGGEGSSQGEGSPGESGGDSE